MKRKKIWLDPGFWVLIGINIYLVYYYYHHKEIFTTLIWLYWAQSVLLGIFNFFDMLTVRKPNMESMPVTAALVKSVNEKPELGKFKNPSAFFFLLHYGFFHIVYVAFIATMKKSGPFQWDFFKYFLIAFIFGQVITFIQHKIQQRKTTTSIGAMFMIPYLRILPMHLTILLPNFLPVSDLGVFLVLKSIADVIMYIATKPAATGKEPDAVMLASQQNLNM